MKSALILGVASAHTAYESTNEQDVTVMKCQYNEGTWMFDLLPFDSIGS